MIAGILELVTLSPLPRSISPSFYEQGHQIMYIFVLWVANVENYWDRPFRKCDRERDKKTQNIII